MTLVGDGAGTVEVRRREDVTGARSRGAAAGAVLGARLGRATAFTTVRFFSVLPGAGRARLRVGAG